MNRSYSKIRHMQQSNLMLENRIMEEKSRQFLMEITDDNGLLTAYPDLKTVLEPKLKAADKTGETSVGVYGSKAYFRAAKGQTNWTIYVYTFGPRTYGRPKYANPATVLTLDFPDTTMNEVPYFFYGSPDTGVGNPTKKFYLSASFGDIIANNGSLKLSTKLEVKTDDEVAADISKHFPGFDAAKLVTIANNLKLGSYAKNLSKETRAKLTGVAKTVYDTIAGPAQK